MAQFEVELAGQLAEAKGPTAALDLGFRRAFVSAMASITLRTYYASVT
jgi:hypothetical protein